MSVLIKGMRMPQNCDECFCVYETAGVYWNYCQVTDRKIDIFAEDRPEFCPLVEVKDGDNVGNH